MTPSSVEMFREMWFDYRRAMHLRRTEATRRTYRFRVRLALRWVRDERRVWES